MDEFGINTGKIIYKKALNFTFMCDCWTRPFYYSVIIEA